MGLLPKRAEGTIEVRRGITVFFRRKHQMTPARIILIGFALLILAGAITLLSPPAAEQLNGSSAVTVNGSGLLFLFCIGVICVCAVTVAAAMYLAKVTANDDELLDKVNKGIKAVKEKGIDKQLLAKWNMN